jgi:hypothetical protein
MSPFLVIKVCGFRLSKTKPVYNPCTQEALQIGIWNINVENMKHEVPPSIRICYIRVKRTWMIEDTSTDYFKVGDIR